MNYSDFESNNGVLLKNGMNGKDLRTPRYQERRVIKRKIVKQPEVRLRMEDEGHYNYEGETNYPINNDKKIFGMRPKTLAVTLGIIVIAIVIINMTGVKNTEVVNNGIM